jgi:hypothetical protein
VHLNNIFCLSRRDQFDCASSHEEGSSSIYVHHCTLDRRIFGYGKVYKSNEQFGVNDRSQFSVKIIFCPYILKPIS